MQKKLALLWQTGDSWYREWILEILSPLVEREVFDGRHETVLDDCILVDANLQLIDRSYYRQFRGRNAFLFRESDEYYRDVSIDAYENFCGVIRSQYSAAFRPERVMHVPVGYARGEARRNDPKPASERKYAWVMLGQMNKASRPEALSALLHVEPNYWYASDGWRPGGFAALGSTLQNAPIGDYVSMISEAAFCPSPMGNVSLETGRPYAALEAGSIPILERRFSIDPHRRLLGKHPLPTFSSWTLAAEFVKRMWADKRALDQLQADCLAWWSNYKSNVAVEIEGFVNRLWNNHPSGMGAFVRGYARIPGWPAFELLRHHNLPALRRRIQRQTMRLIQQGRLFERH